MSKLLVVHRYSEVNKTFLLFFTAMLIVIPYFSTNVGISIGPVKVNISDIILILLLAHRMLNVDRFITIDKNYWQLITPWLVLTIYWMLNIPLGLIHNADISDSIRIIRNVLYILMIVLLFERTDSKARSVFYYDLFLTLIGIISSIDVIMHAIGSQQSTGWYAFYRANGFLNIFIFCYLFFGIKRSKGLFLVAELGALTLLISASFLSQERTQLMSIGVAMLVGIFAKAVVTLKRGIKVPTFQSISKFTVTVFCVLIIILMLSQIPRVQAYLQYFNQYRLVSGNLFSSGGIASDDSYQGRLIQYNVILDRRNIFSILFGDGTSAKYMAAQGSTSIVDGSFLWVYKDLGLLGLLVYLWAWIGMLIGSLKTIGSYGLSVFTGVVCIFVFSLFNPSFITSIGACLCVSFILFIEIRQGSEKE